MIKKGIGVTLIFILSTFVQLVSQIVVTRIFGATLNLDIFLAAVAIPTILVTVVYGTLNDAFLPLYGEEKVKSPSSSDTYFMTHLLFLSLLFFVIAYIMNFLSLPISHFLYAKRGVEFVQAVATQMNFMVYSLPLSVIATMFGAYYYSHKQFMRFPIAQLIGSVANLIIIISLYPSMGIWALIIAFVLNILIQILFVFPKLSFSVDFSHLKLGTLFLIWIPLIIGNFALRTDTLLIRSFAAQLPEGYLVYLNLISKIFSLGTSVMTIGIQVILLPHLVEYFSKKEYGKAVQSINKAKIMSIGISIGITLMLALFAPLLIKLLFVGNKFSLKDADLTISLLPFFILPAIGWGVNNVFFQPLLALKKGFQLGVINLIALALAWMIGGIVRDQIGVLAGITTGLTILLFSGIIGSEIVWQYHKKKLLSTLPQS